MNKILKYGGIAIIALAVIGSYGGSDESSSENSSKPQSAVTQSVKQEETIQQKALKDKSVPTEYRNALKRGYPMQMGCICLRLQFMRS